MKLVFRILGWVLLVALAVGIYALVAAIWLVPDRRAHTEAEIQAAVDAAPDDRGRAGGEGCGPGHAEEARGELVGEGVDHDLGLALQSVGLEFGNGRFGLVVRPADHITVGGQDVLELVRVAGGM